MKVTVRADPTGSGRMERSELDVAEPATVGSILTAAGLEIAADTGGRRLVVTVNGRRIDRSAWDHHLLKDGDTIAVFSGLAGG